jgi:phospho-N-acetylmuramoyl-pentapeptide-transferase
VIGRSILVPLGVLGGYALLGAIDDWEGIRGPRRGLGMRARTKFILQVIIAIFVAYALKYVLQAPELFWFAYPGVIPLGVWYIPIAVFIIVGMSNAVNFTDGLDGLAGLISATAFAAYGGIALLQQQVFLARFCFTIVGALFGFLWFNVHPQAPVQDGSISSSLRAARLERDAGRAAFLAGWPVICNAWNSIGVGITAEREL